MTTRSPRTLRGAAAALSAVAVLGSALPAAAAPSGTEDPIVVGHRGAAGAPRRRAARA